MGGISLDQSSFNGAPAHQPGRQPHGHPCLKPPCCASMEPQLISRGDARMPISLQPSTGSFNGAPAHQPGRRPRAHHHGRGAHRQRRALASMEPQLISRGDSGGRTGARCTTPRFNGAPAHQPGRPVAHEGQMVALATVLQWSPSSSAGETIDPRDVPGAKVGLQWSPSSSAGETSLSRYRLLSDVDASMEPQLISRGDHATRRFRGQRRRASMEPQLISRGDLPR